MVNIHLKELKTSRKTNKHPNSNRDAPDAHPRQAGTPGGTSETAAPGRRRPPRGDSTPGQTGTGCRRPDGAGIRAGPESAGHTGVSKAGATPMARLPPAQFTQSLLSGGDKVPATRSARQAVTYRDRARLIGNLLPSN